MTTDTIEAPMPGVFYRRPNPDEPRFFEEGDHVEEDDVIALIGVMKNFHDITPTESGTIEEFFVENEIEIEAGEELVAIERE